MSRILPVAAFCSLFLAVQPAAQATLIEFAPADQTAELGDTVAVDIVATPEGGELIGAYDFIVNFDPAVLALNGVIFGASLNDDPFFCNLLGCRDFFDTGGAVEMFELASPFTPLVALQDGVAPVVLATLIFDAIGVGISGLSFTGNVLGQAAPSNLLGDEFGIPLAVFDPGTGQVVVNAPPVTVPEPATWTLMLAGLLIMTAGFRRRPIRDAVR